MKKIFLLVYSIPFLLFAQIQWQDNGIPIRQAKNINYLESLQCMDGNQVLIWSDTRLESRGIYAQKVDIEGNLLWSEEGIQVINADYSQINPKAISTENNDVLIVWKDWRNPEIPELRMQKLDCDGNLLWDPEGIILGTSLYISNFRLINDVDNGAFLIWQNSYSSQQGAYAVHVLEDGSIATGWSASGNLIISDYLTYAVSDGAGGVVFTFGYNDELRMQRMDATGNMLWNSNGNLLSDFDTYAFNCSICRNSDETFYFIWKDQRDGEGIYCQRVDETGSKLWDEDVEIVHNTDFYIRQSISTSDNALIVSRIEENNPIQVILQKVSPEGIIQWDQMGVVVSGDQNSYRNDIIADNGGGCWLTWMSSDNKIYLQHINTDGTNVLEEYGILVCPSSYYQFYSQINQNSLNGIFVNWYANRDGHVGIYSQVFNNSGTMQLAAEGLEIYTGIDNEIQKLELIATPNGINFLWRDQRFVDHTEIFLQSLDENGFLLHSVNGISLTPENSSFQHGYESHYHSETDLLAIVWEWEYGFLSQVSAQAVDASGTSVWSQEGVALAPSHDQQFDVKISSDNNFIYTGWTANSGAWQADNYVVAQKLDENGNLLWGEEGITITNLAEDDSLNAITGRCYFWLNTDFPPFRLYAKLLDENGNTAPGWSDDGLWLSILPGCNYIRDLNARAIKIPLGYLIFWQDRHNSNADIKGQLITEEGLIMWEDGGLPIVVNESFLTDFEVNFDDELFNTFFVWEDYRSGNHGEIYVQKIDINGNMLWSETGICISEGLCPDIARIGDYILLVWEDETENYTNNIKAQLINQSGEILWQEGGITICDSFHDQLEPKVEAIDTENFVLSWRDNRAGIYGENEILCTSIYAQKIHIEPTYTPNEILNTITGKLNQNHPNPFNPTTTISFSVAQTSSFVNVEIYNIKGQKIRTLVNNKLDKGNHSIVWDGKNESGKIVSSGIFFYRLSVNGNSISVKKCLLLK